VQVDLQLDSGYREVEMPTELTDALHSYGLADKFRDLVYSKRKEFARSVSDARAIETKRRRISKIVTFLKQI
jgi:uncharacterized protein YdeI (YjbR/CyaY-like superfamily)